MGYSRPGALPCHHVSVSIKQDANKADHELLLTFCLFYDVQGSNDVETHTVSMWNHSISRTINSPQQSPAVKKCQLVSFVLN